MAAKGGTWANDILALLFNATTAPNIAINATSVRLPICTLVFTPLLRQVVINRPQRQRIRVMPE